MGVRLRQAWKAAKVLMAAVVIIALGLFVWLKATEVSAQDLPLLSSGDLVFQTSGSSQSLPILLASNSIFTHMGIIELGNGGVPQVVEAVGPVRTIPLDQWIRRGVGNRIAVMRFAGLASDDLTGILQAAHRYDGLPYDIYFLDSRDQIYCSELVRLAFSEGAGIALGKAQKVRELDLDYGPVRKLIKARWQKHPACIKAGVSTFETCYEIILDGELVTPESIARDGRLEMVFSNFGAAWRK